MSRPTRTPAAARPDRTGRASWAGDPPQRRAARERLLEAAARCIAREGLAAPAPGRSPAALRAFLERRLLPALGLPAAARQHLPSPRHVKE